MALKATLDHFDPRLWPILIAFVVYLVGLAWKRWLPVSFAAVPPRFKAVPAALIGAALAGTTGSQAILDILIGATSGLTAVGGHEAMTRFMTGAGTAAAPPCAKCAETKPRRPFPA